MPFSKIIKATKEKWESSNPVLDVEEFAFSTDFEGSFIDLRQGDGKKSWTDLPSIVNQGGNTEIYEQELSRCDKLIGSANLQEEEEE